MERRIVTSRERFTAVLGTRAPAQILLEASTGSEWAARHVEALGHAVIVADPGFAAMYATRSKRVKTDERDARTLCEALQLGAYRAIHRASDAQRSEYSSGDHRLHGRITNRRDARMRWLLVEAAWRLLRSTRPELAGLKAWAVQIAQRRGKRIAVVALARRVAGILYAMWRDDTPMLPCARQRQRQRFVRPSARSAPAMATAPTGRSDTSPYHSGWPVPASTTVPTIAPSPSPAAVCGTRAARRSAGARGGGAESHMAGNVIVSPTVGRLHDAAPTMPMVIAQIAGRMRRECVAA